MKDAIILFFKPTTVRMSTFKLLFVFFAIFALLKMTTKTRNNNRGGIYVYRGTQYVIYERNVCNDNRFNANTQFLSLLLSFVS